MGKLGLAADEVFFLARDSFCNILPHPAKHLSGILERRLPGATVCQDLWQPTHDDWGSDD